MSFEFWSLINVYPINYVRFRVMKLSLLSRWQTSCGKTTKSGYQHVCQVFVTYWPIHRILDRQQTIFNKTFHLELTGEIQSLEWLQRISGHEIQGHRCKSGPCFVGKITLLDYYWHIRFIINWEMFQKSNVFSDFWIEWFLKKQISPQICTEVINLVKLLYFFNKIS